MIVTKFIPSFILFGICRSITGFGIGMGMSMQTLYLAEISPPIYRGLMGFLTGLSVEIGSSLGSWLGLRAVLGSDRLW
jgi:MFS family permease